MTGDISSKFRRKTKGNTPLMFSSLIAEPRRKEELVLKMPHSQKPFNLPMPLTLNTGMASIFHSSSTQSWGCFTAKLLQDMKHSSKRPDF